MDMTELKWMLHRLIAQDRLMPEVYRPIVAIGHSKDLVDVPTIEMLLSFLGSNNSGSRHLEISIRDYSRRPSRSKRLQGPKGIVSVLCDPKEASRRWQIQVESV